MHSRSVRVKRVFLLLARHSGHAWYSRLDLTRVDLGTGKRQLTAGGCLDKQFLITVAEQFADASCCSLCRSGSSSSADLP